MKLSLSILGLLCLAGGLHAQTPSLFKDINSGAGPGLHPVTQFQEFNGQLYFRAQTVANGWELYRTSGIQVNLSYDVAPGANGGFSGSSTYPMFAVFKGKLYLTAGNSNPGGVELYASDSNGSGRFMYAMGGGCSGCKPGVPQDYGQFNNLLFFSADTFEAGGVARDLYKYDGLSRPVRLHSNIHGVAGGSKPKYLTSLNGKKGDKLYFSSRINAKTWTLHEYDAAGNIREVVGARGITDIQRPRVQGTTMYFAGRTASYGLELYSFDGDTARRMTDLAPGPKDGLNGNNDFCLDPCFFNEDIYFSGSTDSVNYQLYAMNVQTGTVRRAATINPAGDGMVSNLTVYAGALYFSAFTPATGYELHRYDGTTEQLVADIWPGQKSGLAIHGALSYTRPGFQEFKGPLYFAGTDSLHNSELWRLDARTGISKLSWTGKALVVPNPAHADASLELSLIRTELLTIQVTDITGRTVYSLPVNEYHPGKTAVRLPLEPLPAGTYLYRVMSGEGQVIASGTIVH